MKYKRVIIGLCLIVFGWKLIEVDRRAKIVVCDVGQGNGVLIQSGSRQLIYDFGPDNKKMVKCLEKYMPVGDKEIEGGIVSHWDSDHYGGLEEVEKYYDIDKLWANEATNGAAVLRKNDSLEMGLIHLDIINPEELTGEENRDSIVAELTRGDFKMLLMGDVTTDEEERMVWREELKDKIQILLVSHHGSGEATSQTLLNKVTPQEAIISVGKNNRFGHPSEAVVKRLEMMGIRVRRTDEEGNIVLEIE